MPSSPVMGPQTYDPRWFTEARSTRQSGMVVLFPSGSTTAGRHGEDGLHLLDQRSQPPEP